MSAFKQNPFLVGFTVVMVLGVGALGYLTYSAAEDHSKAESDYEDTAGELKRLQSLKPFPNDEHLKKFQEQRQQLQVKVDGLQKSLSEIKIEMEEISPTGFQDKLRDSVAKATSRKSDSNVEFPDKFYMGFAEYQGNPPRAAAARPLYRELRAIEEVVNLILEVKNVKLLDLSRSPLKEEQDAKPAVDPKTNKPIPVKEEGRKLVEKDTFNLKFSTSPENFQRILNGIVTNKEQFFIPRYLVIENSLKEPRPKTAALPTVPVPAATLAESSAAPGATPVNPADPAAAAAPAAPEAPKLEYIFGKEDVIVSMDVDLVDVKAPETKDAKADPKAPTAEAKK